MQRRLIWLLTNGGRFHHDLDFQVTGRDLARLRVILRRNSLEEVDETVVLLNRRRPPDLRKRLETLVKDPPAGRSSVRSEGRCHARREAYAQWPCVKLARTASTCGNVLQGPRLTALTQGHWAYAGPLQRLPHRLGIAAITLREALTGPAVRRRAGSLHSSGQPGRPGGGAGRWPAGSCVATRSCVRNADIVDRDVKAPSRVAEEIQLEAGERYGLGGSKGGRQPGDRKLRLAARRTVTKASSASELAGEQGNPYAVAPNSRPWSAAWSALQPALSMASLSL
jgi:hypothetical protein